MLVLGYHADDEILRWWAIAGVVGAVLILLLALALARRPQRAGGGEILPIVALVTAGLTAVAMATGFDVVGVLLGLLALAPAVALARSRRTRLALPGFVAGALAFDLGASAVAACAITDACLH